jgi:hypothetical protein
MFSVFDSAMASMPLSRNELLPILVTLSGILMLLRLLHLKKAKSPILFTLSGMLMLLNPMHLEKV